MLNKQKDWFVKDSVWGDKLSRSLQRMGGAYDHAIEVSIEPINDTEAEWEEIKLIRIRNHTTKERDANFAHHYDSSIEQLVIHKIGEEFSNILFHTDLLGAIDVRKLRIMKTNWLMGGGIPFILVCRNQSDFLPLRDHWREMLGRDDFNGETARKLQTVYNEKVLGLPNAKCVPTDGSVAVNLLSTDTVHVRQNPHQIPMGVYKTVDMGKESMDYLLQGELIKPDTTKGVASRIRDGLKTFAKVLNGTFSATRVILVRRSGTCGITEVRMDVENNRPKNVEVNNYDMS